METNPKKFLYFCKGMSPTKAEREEAQKLGITKFRNASLTDGDTVEECQAVAGSVPEAYKKLPRVTLSPAKPEGKPEGKPEK